jgi:transcription initiation factor IIE alpha subunit
MTTDKAKIIELLVHSMSEATLSKKSGIPLIELRPLLGKLCDEKIIDHMGKMIWLKSSEDQYGRVDISKIPGMKNLIGLAWKQKKRVAKM